MPNLGVRPVCGCAPEIAAEDFSLGAVRREVPAGELRRQAEIMERAAARNAALPRAPLALVDTYGCQQNEADSEKLRGMLARMGYGFTDDPGRADVVVMNTCAVRGHAEQRVFGNVGALSHTKAANPAQVVALCGCMMQEPGMAEKVKKSYRYVDLVFGTHALWRFPELLEEVLAGGGRVFETAPEDGSIAEGLPSYRTGGVKAWLPVMYGCDNFCSYCIVPYVRGRERSREPAAVLADARALAASGAKDIMLLGENVNSYGKGLPEKTDFASLLRALSGIDGEFVLRFMTSHPKDAGEALFAAMAELPKVERHLHLPFQSGSDRILKAMNRRYDSAAYLRLAALARSYMPDLVLTSDVIVGFPGETEEDFGDTMKLVETVRFDALFTFIYSPRTGTPAAKLPDPATREEKQARFERLLALQNGISAEKHAAYVGKTLRVLADGTDASDPALLTGRTQGGRLVRFPGGAELVGRFLDVEITGSSTWALAGKLSEGEKQ